LKKILESREGKVNVNSFDNEGQSIRERPLLQIKKKMYHNSLSRYDIDMGKLFPAILLKFKCLFKYVIVILSPDRILGVMTCINILTFKCVSMREKIFN
jgi:hypothetical protein